MSPDYERARLIEGIIREVEGEVHFFTDFDSLWKLISSPAKRKKFFLCLELYHISLAALWTELLETLTIGDLKTWYRGMLMFLRWLIIRVRLSPNDSLIVSSNLRKDFLVTRGFPNQIYVVKNKPLVLEGAHSRKRRRVVISGNHRGKEAMRDCVERLSAMGMDFEVFGVNSETKAVVNEVLPDLEVGGKLTPSDAVRALSIASHALVMYSSKSHNQRLSASSKIFEIYNAGCIPIIASNCGLHAECLEEQIPFVSLDELSSITVEASTSRVDPKLFSHELMSFRTQLGAKK